MYHMACYNAKYSLHISQSFLPGPKRKFRHFNFILHLAIRSMRQRNIPLY